MITSNGLQEPFIDFLRNLLDNDENKIIMPMFDAFAADVKRLSAQPAGLRSTLEPVGDRPVFPDPELVKTKELLKEVHDSLCEVLGVSTASGDAHWTKLVQSVRQLRAELIVANDRISYFEKNQPVDAPHGAYSRDLADVLGLDGDHYTWDELLRGVAVHVKQSKELPIVKARVIELEAGGCRKKAEGEARLIGGSPDPIAVPKPEGSKPALTPAQIERNEKMRIGRERYQAEQRAKKEVAEIEPEISAAAETLIEAVNNDIGDTPGPEATNAHQATPPRIHTPRNDNRVVPAIGCEFPWPYSFSPEDAGIFFGLAVNGTSVDAILDTHPSIPDIEIFFDDRGGLVRTIRSMSPEARRGKVIELQKSWLEGLTKHGRCGDA